MRILAEVSIFLMLLSLSVSAFAAQKIENKIATLQFNSENISEELVAKFSEELREALRGNGYEVLSREEMEEKTEELSEELFPCPEKSCAIIIGKALGVDKVIIGYFRYHSGSIEGEFSRIDVSTGVIEDKQGLTVKNETAYFEEQIQKITEELGDRFSGKPADEFSGRKRVEDIELVPLDEPESKRAGIFTMLKGDKIPAKLRFDFSKKGYAKSDADSDFFMDPTGNYFFFPYGGKLILKSPFSAVQTPPAEVKLLVRSIVIEVGAMYWVRTKENKYAKIMIKGSREEELILDYAYPY